mmetsp:Transcript_32415/g.85551  ORF Transcript_32415/g.85551 Transcript_32415/m.85551 type:complete len:449 (+) Transcript_32415:100-1446(+)
MLMERELHHHQASLVESMESDRCTAQSETSTLSSMLYEGTAAYEASVTTPCLQRATALLPSFTNEVSVASFMVVGGALTSFFGGALYTLSPPASSADLSTLTGDLWLTYVMTLGQFTTNVIFTSNAENVRALRARASPRFVAQLCVPSSIDIFVTGAATVALSLVPPALVGILKTAIQLLSIAVISRLIQRTPQSHAVWLALLVVLAGVACVVAVDIHWRGNEHRHAQSSMGQQVVGLSLVAASGWIGAWRNIIEAAILQDDGLPSPALLMAESAISMAVLAPFSVILVATSDGRSTSNFAATLLTPAGIPLLLLFVITAYVKDAGKFWLIQHASALRQKILALIFPFGTWLIGLAVYYLLDGRSHTPFLGVRWVAVASPLRLLGFLVIVAANVAFLLVKGGRGSVCSCCERAETVSTLFHGRSYTVYRAAEVQPLDEQTERIGTMIL